MRDFQCAIGSSQLQRLDQFIQKRQEIAKRYDKSFSGNDILTIPKIHSSIEHAYHLYPLLINFDKLILSKQQFFEKMKFQGINLQVHYIPVHLQPYYRNNFGFKRGNYPIAENFYLKEVSLPIYPDLVIEDQAKVIEKVNRICSV